MPTPRLTARAFIIVFGVVIGLALLLTLMLQTALRPLAQAVLVGMLLLTVGLPAVQLVAAFRTRAARPPRFWWVLVRLVLIASSAVAIALILLPGTELTRTLASVNRILLLGSTLGVSYTSGPVIAPTPKR